VTEKDQDWIRPIINQVQLCLSQQHSIYEENEAFADFQNLNEQII